MSGLYRSAFVALVLIGAAARADVTVTQPGEDFQLKVGGRLQTMGLGENVADSYGSPQRAYLYMKEARVRASGAYKDMSLDMELALGGEAAVAAPNPGVWLGLMDLSATIPVFGESTVKVGQFKVPYGREGLTYTGESLFVDTSIDHLGFRAGRDVGAALNLKRGRAMLLAGVFTGGGRDVPQKYLPEHLGMPLLAVRAGYGNVDENPYKLTPVDRDTDRTKWAFFLNGLYSQDSLIGHSSVFNVKMADKSLLLNGSWNPYVGRAEESQGQMWQAGADAALRQRITDNVALSAEAEANIGEFTNAFGTVQLAGGRVQGALSYGRMDVGIRYAVLLPDSKFAAAGTSITGGQAIHEVTPALSFHVRDGLKLVADFPVLVNVPVAMEKGVGSYVLSEMPDQAGIVAKAGNIIKRENVEQARLMVQASF